ncbi:uncharacterized protein LOC116438279 [Corvus moneduloides]|uniref:uncharacterized protein LOC116438279 n=1 Tax=Corvus moneduloides TaxID=1196302 RepID=UPI0013627044|nr:uncharacterized protein LOC116438279 [Corvus moneduloides]
MNRAVTSPSSTRLVSCARGQSLDERKPRAGHCPASEPRASARQPRGMHITPAGTPGRSRLPARAAPQPPSAGTYLRLFTSGMTNLPGVCLSRPSRQRCVPISAADRPARSCNVLEDLCCKDEELPEEVIRLHSIREEERETDRMFSETQQLEKPPAPSAAEKLAVFTPNVKTIFLLMAHQCPVHFIGGDRQEDTLGLAVVLYNFSALITQ